MRRSDPRGRSGAGKSSAQRGDGGRRPRRGPRRSLASLRRRETTAGAAIPAAEPSPIHLELAAPRRPRSASGPRGPWRGRSSRRGRAPAATSAGPTRSAADPLDMIAEISDAWLVPENAFFPSPSRRARAPNAKMSVRASASLPSSCSGAMYWNVPRIVPSCVRPCCVGRDVRLSIFAARRRHHLRQPEVEELHARLRQHHVAGLQVPVHDPLPVRFVQRVGDLDAVAQRLLQRQRRPSPADPASVSPSRYSMTRYSIVALASHVVERADVRMRELRDRLRLPLEALPDLGRRRHVRRQHLHRHRPLQPRVPRLVDLPHPAGAERRQDLVRAEPRARADAHFFSSPAVQFVTSVIGESSCGGPECTRNFLPSFETS